MRGDWDEYDDVEPPERKSRTGHFRVGTGFPGETQYEYATQDEFGILRSHLAMTVSHHRPRSTYIYPDSRYIGEQFGEYMPRPAEALKDLRTPGPGGQLKLFGMHSTPGHSKVDYLGGTKRGRVHVATMLGIAQNRTQQDYGRDLEPSSDLSPHSSKVVGHLAKRGVLQSDVETRASNDIDFAPNPRKIYDEDSDPIPASEARQGKRTMARMLKGRRKPAAEPSSSEKRGRPYEARRR